MRKREFKSGILMKNVDLITDLHTHKSVFIRTKVIFPLKIPFSCLPNLVKFSDTPELQDMRYRTSVKYPPFPVASATFSCLSLGTRSRVLHANREPEMGIWFAFGIVRKCSWVRIWVRVRTFLNLFAPEPKTANLRARFVFSLPFFFF